MNNKVYIIFAADKSSTVDPFALNAYAAAATYDLAEKIAKNDVKEDAIFPDYSIEEMFLAISESEI